MQQKKKVLYAGAGIGVSIWSGDLGDTRLYTYPEACTRVAAPFASLIIDGSVEIEMPTGAAPIPYSRSDELPDLPAGVALNRFTRNWTQQMCIGAVDEADRAVWAPVGKAFHVGVAPFTLAAGRVAMIATGAGTVNGQPFTAPFIVHADGQDVEITFTSPGAAVEMWRP